MTQGQEQNVNDLMKARDELIGERDKLLDELVKLRASLEDSQGKHADLEKKFDEANNTISQVRKNLILSRLILRWLKSKSI